MACSAGVSCTGVVIQEAEALDEEWAGEPHGLNSGAGTGRVAILIKWMRDCHVKDILNGILHLNTPEFYRLRPSDAFGDPNESCGYSYRLARDATPPLVIVAGEKMKGFTALTAARGTGRESYMHCWTALTIPRDSAELRAIKRDFRRMRDEFGPTYVGLPGDRIPQLLKRIEEADGLAPLGRLVDYSDDRNKWGSLCKDSRYAFQREFRFLVGPCFPSDPTPKKLFLGDHAH